MKDPGPGDVTRLLQQVARGDKLAERELIPLVYNELRRLAGRYMRGEAPDHTLQATALVHEAYLRLARPSQPWESRSHFFAVAAKVMRQILVDHARARRSAKRGGGATVDDLNDVLDIVPAFPVESERMLALDDALARLASLDERQCRIFELRFFAGLTVEEIADVLNVSPRTVKRDWHLAKAWLYGELNA